MARKTVEIVPTPAGLSGYTAEIGSAMLGAMIGLRPDHLEDHAAYVADWLTLLRDEPKAFLSAAAKAQTAIDWLTERAGHPAGADVGPHVGPHASAEAAAEHHMS